MLCANAAQASAQRTVSPVTLPPELTIDPIGEYEGADTPGPPPRRGMVLRGFHYDAHNSPYWANDAVESSAAACDNRLQLPPAITRGGEGRPITQDFWLYHAPPEALYITRHITIAAIEDCVARPIFELRVYRIIFSGPMVTTLERSNGRWFEPATVPFGRNFDFAADSFLVPDDLARLNSRYSRVRTPTVLASRFGNNIACWNIGISVDYISECRWTGRGAWRGILVSRWAFHSTTYDEGTEVEAIDASAVIDGRLFEWDRDINLAD